ncbi:MAG: hypothetical protein ACRD2J_06000, partial [Thermoanaerobaculia bacterium]
MSDIREITSARSGGAIRDRRTAARRRMALRRFDWLRERGPGDKAVRRGGPASARLQAALFRIADLTLACEDLDALYRSIHQVVAELMDATNFYIAVYDEPADTLSFPYFVDQYDPKPERRRPGKTLTAY